MYDYLIVGSGLAGSTIANILKRKEKEVLVIEKKKHVGGSIRTVKRENIDIHLYGAHIFHTSDKKIYDYLWFINWNTWIYFYEGFKSLLWYGFKYCGNFDNLRSFTCKKI